MNKTVNLGLIFKNRIGIVSQVSKRIFENGGNIIHSDMIKLGNHFAFDLTAIFSNDYKSDTLTRELNYQSRISSLIGGSVHGETFSYNKNQNISNRLDKNCILSLSDDTYKSQIKLYSSDNPGIIHSTCEKLESLNADIIRLKSFVTPAPFSSNPIFGLDVEFNIDRSNSKEMIKDTLEEVVNNYYCDIDIN